MTKGRPKKKASTKMKMFDDDAEDDFIIKKPTPVKVQPKEDKPVEPKIVSNISRLSE